MNALQFDFLDHLFKSSYNNCMEDVKYVIRDNKKFAITHCLNCGKKKLKAPNQLRKHRNSFCDSSCAATYNNNIRRSPKRKKEGVQFSCIHCGKKNKSTYVTAADLKKVKKGKKVARKGKFCSNKCQGDYGWEIKKGQVINHGVESLPLTGTHRHQAYDRITKQIIIELNPHGESGRACWKCGWEKENPFTKKGGKGRGSRFESNIPTQLNHIDGNPLNNNLSNLEILCPNCHYLTEFHGSRGKGGRKRKD